MAKSSIDRNVHLATCMNLRELGGLLGLHKRPVRRGRIYRSMTPEYLDAADLEKARGLNIGLIVDFRGPRFETSGPLGEPPARRVGFGPPAGTGSTVQSGVNAFMAMSPEEALPHYMIRYGQPYANAIREISGAPDVNVLYHCRLGKDRTGVFTALLLKLLQVSDEDIVEDHMLTAQVEPELRRFLDGVEPTDARTEPLVAREPVSRRAMECVLERLESQYGTAYSYFEHLGVPAAELDALIDNLLEPVATPSLSEANQPRSSTRQTPTRTPRRPPHARKEKG